MSVRDYVKAALGEYVIVLLAAAALAWNLSTALYASAAGNPVISSVTCAVLLVVLFAVAYDKRTLLWGCVGLAAVALVCVVVAVVMRGAEAFADAEDNLFLFECAVVGVCVGTFALSRTKVGSIVLACVGCVSLGMVEYLYQELHYVSACLFVLACAMLVIWRCYRLALKGTQARKASFVSTFALAAGSALVMSGVALGVYLLVIAPLDPSAQEVKLITEYWALEEVPRRGTNEELALTDPDLTSALTSNTQNQVNQDESQDSERDANQTQGLFESIGSGLSNFAAAMGLTTDGAQDLRLITHNLPWYGWLLIIVLLALLIGGPIALKKALRERFYRKALAQGPRGFVIALYQRFVRNFRRLGVDSATSATPWEYVVTSERPLAAFAENEGGVTFARITEAFMRASFSREEITDDDVAACCAFYKSMYRNCRRYAGRLRYTWLFFRL